MDPTQRVIADAELAGVVGHDHYVAHQTMMADRTPKSGFSKRANILPIEDIDTLAGQMRHERHLVAEALWFKRPKPGDHDWIATALLQIIECGIVEYIILVIAAQQRQEIQARLRFCRSEDGKIRAADMCGVIRITNVEVRRRW